MENSEIAIVETSPHKSRKRLQRKDQWKVNRAKDLRYSPINPPQVRLPCNHYTKAYRCSSLKPRDIMKFYKAFYKTSNKIHQDNFILKYTKVSKVHRRRAVNGQGNAKTLSTTYYALRNHSVIPVCKKTFLSILGIKKGRVAVVISRHFKNNGEMATETRGGNRKEIKYGRKKQAIKEFIKTLIPLEIHYCRSKIKCRQYLSSDLNINKLYKMFILQASDEHKDIKSSYFRFVFKTSFNIGFGSPRSDVCSECILLDEKINRLNNSNEKSAALIQKRIHKLRAKSFYNLLRDNREDLLILAFDCQKNEPCPKVQDQIAYYSRQLYVYNFTIVVGNSKSQLLRDNVFIYTWTEDLLPKASNEIASAVFHCLCTLFEKPEYRNFTTVRLVADGCSGQNKNTTVLGMASKWLQDYAPSTVKIVELLFPVVGHSYLPPDRVFAKIEKEIKRREVIDNPDKYFEIFKEHGTIYKLGEEVEVHKWKEASTEVFKITGSMHFSFKLSKRFFIKKSQSGDNVGVRAEESYTNVLGKYRNICKVNKTVSQINPSKEVLFVKVNNNKIEDVKKLLTVHYGENWHELPDMTYYNNVIQRHESQIGHHINIERCQNTEELPEIIV